MVERTLTIEDLQKSNPMFAIDNINFYINVACDGFNRTSGAVDKRELSKYRLAKELERREAKLSNLRQQQQELQSKNRTTEKSRYLLLDLYLNGPESFA
jgi:SUMO ligase MMS21 Smc5/6 complex component